MSENGRHRLTSWKEIANHLGRGVRTVLRWEKERGLPVHRVPGANGRVVFAFADELDAWAEGEARAANDSLPPDSVPDRRALLIEKVRARWRLAAALVVVGMAGLALTAVAKKDARPLTIVVSPDGIAALDADRKTRWRYAFPAGERGVALDNAYTDAVDVVDGPESGVLAGTALQFRDFRDPITESPGGQLFWFSRAGELRRTFAFDDRLTFESSAYERPWGMTDFHLDASTGRRRVAVAAHHYEWWPSMVTVLDERWNRHGTFVNAGWIERVWWLDSRRLVIAGFSNPADGGMIALLDTAALDGQSPPVPGRDAFRCTACGPGAPLRYVVMPRSEVNRASASPFNRVVLEPKADGFVARTIEIPSGEPGRVADIIYGFSRSLHLVRAAYSDRYWEEHRALEAQGKIGHSREQCPDRNGPREVRVWEPSAGWTTAGPPRPAESQRPAR
jgi:hypothetical protein